MIEISSIISIVGIVQGLFILFLIISKVRQDTPVFYAFLLIVVFVVDLITFLLHNNDLLNIHRYLIGISESTLFLYGPVLYLYVSSILNLNESRRPPNLILHFLPALIVYILTSPLLLREQTYMSLEELKHQLPPVLEGYSLGSLLIDHVIWYIHALFYFALSLVLLRRFKKNDIGSMSVPNQQARRTHLNWVKYLIIGYFIFPVVGISILTYNLWLGTQASSFSLLNFFLVFHIFCISYIGFKNQKLLLNPIEMMKYRNSTLDEKIKLEYIDRLVAYFENQTPYLNVDLTIKQVAAELNLNAHYISQVVNEHYGFGVNDFINHYRIELAKKLILSPEKSIYTMEAISNEAGFRSKSTFNTAFKKKMGITPSEFKKKSLNLNAR